MRCSAQGCKNTAIGDTPFCPVHSNAPRITPAVAKVELVETVLGTLLKVSPANAMGDEDLGMMFRASSIFGFAASKGDDGSTGTIILGEHGQTIPVPATLGRIKELLQKREATNAD